MHITWHGNYTIKIQSGELTIVIDPYAPSVGLPPFRAKADLVSLSSPAVAAMSHLDAIQGEPKVINTPGEYALLGVTLHALGWRTTEGHERSLQRWQIEDMVIVNVGALDRDMTDHEMQELDKVAIDVLFVPVGGGDALNYKQAVALITKLEPRVVIPVHFALPKLKEKLDGVELFAKEMGVDPKKQEKKVTLKRKTVPQDDLATFILVP